MGLKKEYIDTVVPESTGGAGRSSGTAFVALPSVKIVIAGIVLAALQVAAMNGLLSSSFVYALGNTLIYAIVAIGFCLLLGYSGLASLGTAGFIGLGAYTAFYMIQGLGAPYYLTLLATLAISIAIGVIVGFISLRIEGIYLAIMTLALSEVIRNALMALKATIKIDITNVCLFGVNVNESAVYLLITFTFIVLMLLTSNLIRSPIGRAMIAMKNSTSAAQAMGVSLMLAISRALMASPKLLLLDEPSLGLAPLIIRDIFHALQEIRAEGTTILIVEQNALATLKIADRAYVLELGRISMEGRADVLIHDERLIEAYLGNKKS